MKPREVKEDPAFWPCFSTTFSDSRCLPGIKIKGTVSAITVTRTPEGDYAKALRALRPVPVPSPHSPRPADNSRR